MASFNLNQSINRESAFPLDSREIFTSKEVAIGNQGLYSGQKISIVDSTIRHYTVEGYEYNSSTGKNEAKIEPLINAASGGLITGTVDTDGTIKDLKGTFSTLYIGTDDSYNVKNKIDEKVPKSRKITAGDGLTGTGTLSSDITLNVNIGSGITFDNSKAVTHYTPATVAESNNTGGRTYINSITFDNFGHVTSIGTNTETDTTYDLTSSKSSQNGYATLNLVARGSESKTDSISIVGSGATTVTTNATGTTITINSTNTDTSTTLSGHYTPSSSNSNSTLEKDADSTTSATWNSTSLVTGVNIEIDPKGHVTGLTLDSVKMPEEPDIPELTLSGTTTANVGGIQKNTTYSNTNVIDILKDMLFPHVGPDITSISLSQPAGTYEYGTSVTVSYVTINFTKGSDNINEVKIGTSYGAEDLFSGTSATSGSKINLTKTKTFNGTTGGSIYCYISDGTASDSSSASVSYKYYNYIYAGSNTHSSTTQRKVSEKFSGSGEVSVDADKEQYVWFATRSAITSIKFNGVSLSKGTTDTDDYREVGTNQTIKISTGSSVSGYYLYRTNKSVSAGTWIYDITF